MCSHRYCTKMGHFLIKKIKNNSHTNSSSENESLYFTGDNSLEKKSQNCPCSFFPPSALIKKTQFNAT